LGPDASMPDLLRAAGIEPSVPELELRDDGTYQMGAARGRWRQVGGELVLDGSFSGWGRGAVSVDGNALAFVPGGIADAKLQLTRVEALSSRR